MKGNTNVVQGIIFQKDGCCFCGSEIDRSCSFSRLNAEIERNSHKQEQIHLQNEPMADSVDESYFIILLSGKTQITYKSLRNSLYIGNSAFFFEIQAP